MRHGHKTVLLERQCLAPRRRKTDGTGKSITALAVLVASLLSAMSAVGIGAIIAAGIWWH